MKHLNVEETVQDAESGGEVKAASAKCWT